MSAGSFPAEIPPTPSATPVVAIPSATQGRNPDGACAKKMERTATIAGYAYVINPAREASIQIRLAKYVEAFATKSAPIASAESARRGDSERSAARPAGSASTITPRKIAARK